MRALLGILLALIPMLVRAETAWVTMVNPHKQAVELQIVGAKINLLVQFHDLGRTGIRLNGVAGFEFSCTGGPDGCDLMQPFRIILNGEAGRVIAWQMRLPIQDIRIGWPRNGAGPRAVLKGRIGSYSIILALHSLDPMAAAKVAGTDPAQPIRVALPEIDPHCAMLNSVPFNIADVSVIELPAK